MCVLYLNIYPTQPYEVTIFVMCACTYAQRDTYPGRKSIHSLTHRKTDRQTHR